MAAFTHGNHFRLRVDTLILRALTRKHLVTHFAPADVFPTWQLTRVGKLFRELHTILDSAYALLQRLRNALRNIRPRKPRHLRPTLFLQNPLSHLVVYQDNVPTGIEDTLGQNRTTLFNQRVVPVLPNKSCVCNNACRGYNLGVYVFSIHF